jgi:hypothetical protein
MKLSNWNIFFVVLIVIVIILLCVIIGIVLYKTFASKKALTNTDSVTNTNSVTNPTVKQKVRVRPDRNNKVILVNDKFYRVDPGLYTRPLNYPGVIHHGPDLVDLNS